MQHEPAITARHSIASLTTSSWRYKAAARPQLVVWRPGNGKAGITRGGGAHVHDPIGSHCPFGAPAADVTPGRGTATAALPQPRSTYEAISERQALSSLWLDCCVRAVASFRLVKVRTGRMNVARITSTEPASTVGGAEVADQLSSRASSLAGYRWSPQPRTVCFTVCGDSVTECRGQSAPVLPLCALGPEHF
jgi:hypothetical protein